MTVKESVSAVALQHLSTMLSRMQGTCRRCRFAGYTELTVSEGTAWPSIQNSETMPSVDASGAKGWLLHLHVMASLQQPAALVGVLSFPPV